MSACEYQRAIERRLSLISQYELVFTREKKCEIAREIKALEEEIKTLGKLTSSFFDAVPGAKRCLKC